MIILHKLRKFYNIKLRYSWKRNINLRIFKFYIYNLYYNGHFTAGLGLDLK